jgi:hypothetical protein
LGGYRNGSSIQASDGSRLVIEPFQTGQQYLTQTILPGRKLSQLQIVSQRDRPDIVAKTPNSGGIFHYSAGEVSYRLIRNGQQYQGDAIGVTDVIRGSGVSLWYVQDVYLLEAPADRYQEAAAAYTHVYQTLAVDPHWAAQQSQTTAKQAQIWHQEGQAVNQIITQGYDERQSTMDQIADRRDKAILGQVDVTDPESGKVYRVDSSPSYYWIDKQGYIVGTSTDSRPTVDFRRLVVNPGQ